MFSVSLLLRPVVNGLGGHVDDSFEPLSALLHPVVVRRVALRCGS
jgi:hypothetical protein